MIRVYAVFYRVGWLLARGLAGLYCRVEIHGREHLPVDGAYVLAPVHRSYVDFLLAAIAGRRRAHFMAKEEIFRDDWTGRFLRGIGAFPVNRRGADRVALRTCEELLAAGQPVVMFPEGRRQSGPRVTECLEGPAFVAARQRVPIVPVGIGGSDRVMPIGTKMIYPRKVHIVIGPPLHPNVERPGRVPRAEVRALTGELRAEVQRLYDDAQRRAHG